MLMKMMIQYMMQTLFYGSKICKFVSDADVVSSNDWHGRAGIWPWGPPVHRARHATAPCNPPTCW